MLAAVTPVQMGFPPAASVAAVKSTVTDKKTGLTSGEIRLFVSSAPRATLTRRQWLARCRSRWSVESGNHYHRDVTWQEDRELGRNPRRACTLALLRSALLGVILRDGAVNLSARMFACTTLRSSPVPLSARRASRFSNLSTLPRKQETTICRPAFPWELTSHTSNRAGWRRPTHRVVARVRA